MSIKAIHHFFSITLKRLIISHWYPLFSIFTVFVLISVIAIIFTGSSEGSYRSFFFGIIGTTVGATGTYFIQKNLAAEKLIEEYRFKAFELISPIFTECKLFLISQKTHSFEYDRIEQESMAREYHKTPDYEEDMRPENIERKIASNKYPSDFFNEKFIAAVFELNQFSKIHIKSIHQDVANLEKITLEYHYLLPEVIYARDAEEMYHHIEKMYDMLQRISETLNSDHFK